MKTRRRLPAPGFAGSAALKARLAVVGVAALAALSACGQPSQSTDASKTTIDLSRAKAYHSIQALGADSDTIVVATASAQTSADNVGPVPFTVRSMSVNRVLKGQAPPIIDLRQAGDANTVIADAPLVNTGTTYLLFMQRFQPAPGRTSNQYVITGVAAGLYQVQGGVWARRLDTLSGDLPAAIAIDTLLTQLG